MSSRRNKDSSMEKNDPQGGQKAKASDLSSVMRERIVCELPGNGKVSVKFLYGNLYVYICKNPDGSDGANEEGILLPMNQVHEIVNRDHGSLCLKWEALRDLIFDIQRAVEERR